MIQPAQQLQELLGLSDEELIRTLDASALELLSGELDHRPELGILLDLLAEAEERAGATMLHRWVRANGAHGRPIDLLTGRAAATQRTAAILAAVATEMFCAPRSIRP